MKIIFLLLSAFVYSTTINIPGDYPTIQEGIDVAVDGDTVLVADGDYQENLVLSKSIVLASHAIFDDLDDWVAYDDVFYEEWVINNSHIENTQIIGNNPEDEDYASAILITPNSDTCISPEIIGFTIKYGTGTVVSRAMSASSNERYSARLGGGILADISDPIIKYNHFKQNGTPPNGTPITTAGGAIVITSSSEDWSFNDRFINVNPRCEVDEFQISNNLYNDNDAQIGNSFANRFHELEFDMSGSIFDVRSCFADEGNQVSPAWVKVERTATIDYSDVEGNGCAITALNVYVNPNIAEECFDEECGSPDNPFKTITRTLEMILSTESNPITVHLAEGVYSPSTNGEIFPIIIIDNIIIEGSGENTTIIDAEGSNVVFLGYNAENTTISDLTLTGGYSQYGGGMDLRSVDLILTQITISGNTASWFGGGIFCMECGDMNDSDNYDLTLNDVTINNNLSQTVGAGIYMQSSRPIFRNVLITNNISAALGGGIYAFYSNPILLNVTISNNTSLDSFGGLNFTDCNPIIINSIIWQNGQSIFIYDATPLIIHSNIEGGWEGEGNINSNPLFINPQNGDYSLQEGSPCIDTGTDYFEYADEVILELADNEYYGLAPDMGAFEYTDCNLTLGDLNIDGVIDILDIIRVVNIIMGSTIATEDEECRADITQDGIINILDIIIIINIILES